MKKIYNIMMFFVFFILTTIMLSTTAHAYIDPSANSYILQIVAGTIITGVVTFLILSGK
jgi:hypothetical protein